MRFTKQVNSMEVSMELPVTTTQVLAWERGMSPKEAFPQLTERELDFFKLGTKPKPLGAKPKPPLSVIYNEHDM